jgi:hypothetical protein
MWAAVLSGGCGTAMSWWWEWIDAYDIWPQFGAIAAFTEGIDWPAEGFRPSEDAMVASKPDPEHGFGPLAFAPTAGGFKPAPFNEPVDVRVSKAGKLDAPGKLPRILHGLRNHRDLHNPVTFRVEFPRPTTFAVVVDGVSGHGGAAIEIRLDGEITLEKEFADNWPDDTKRMAQYDGAYEIRVPAGRHTITVENKGNDWFFVRTYEFGAGRPTPPVRVLSLRGKRTILVWVWNDTHAWYRPVFHTPLVRLREVVVTLAGIRPARYRVRPFDTWSGKWGQQQVVTVGADGKARLPIGDLRRDAALRLERVESRP